MATVFPKNAFVIAGVIFALAITLVGIFAPLIATHDPYESSIGALYADPGADNWFGGDHLGRDVFSRIVWSFRFYVISGALALVMGTCAAWLLVFLRSTGGTDTGPRHLPRGGVLSHSILQLSSQTFVIGLLLGIIVIVIVGVVGSGFLQMVIYTGVVSAILPLSLVYQSVQRAIGSRARLEQTFLVGEGPGPSPIRLALAQGFALAPVSFSLTVLLSLFIESPLSYQGMGLPPPEPSLGGMLAAGGISPAFRYARSEGCDRRSTARTGKW